jgi:hypothetical protein
MPKTHTIELTKDELMLLGTCMMIALPSPDRLGEVDTSMMSMLINMVLRLDIDGIHNLNHKLADAIEALVPEEDVA